MDLTKTITVTLIAALLTGGAMINSASAAVETRARGDLSAVTHSGVSSDVTPRIGESETFYRSTDLTAVTHHAAMMKHDQHAMRHDLMGTYRRSDITSTTHN